MKYIFAAALLVASFDYANAQQCSSTASTCNSKCITRDDCAKWGTGYTWKEELCPGDNCGCCQKIEAQCESTPNCDGGKCISKDECIKMGVEYSWNDDTCPGENCGCCKADVPCLGTASMCPKGICISRDECAKKGSGYTWNDDKCPGENCGCCEEVAPCLTTATTCPNGKCISKEECEKAGTNYVWNEKTCPGDNCGCCEEVAPCLITAPSCPNGKCISREECAKAGIEYSWSVEKCEGKNCGCCEKELCLTTDTKCASVKGVCNTSGTVCPDNSFPDYTLCGAGDTCFCCVPKCFKDPQCSQFPNGRCMKSQDECKLLGPSFSFSPKMCRREGAESTCGCCYSNCMEKDQYCSAKSGKCVPSKESCPTNQGFTFDPSLCQVDPTTGVTNCGCCYPPCKRTDPTCEEKGGKCLPNQDSCPITQGFIFDPTLCRNDPVTGELKCGCCYPKPVECKPRDPECKAKGGVCVASVDKCDVANGATFINTLCRTSAANADTKCGCCVPAPKPCLEVDPKCVAKKGKCLTNKDACKSVTGAPLIFDETLCRTENADATCGCCYKQKPCKQSEQCAAKKGKCINKLFTANLCNADVGTVDPTLCGGETSDCVCCIPNTPA